MEIILKFRAKVNDGYVYSDSYVDLGFYFDATKEYEQEQFTGLKDKNGTDIYEGDILRYRNRLGKVVWHKYQASFDLVFIKNIEGEPFIAMKEGMDNNKWSFETVIVGNIHQNKELLNNA